MSYIHFDLATNVYIHVCNGLSYTDAILKELRLIRTTRHFKLLQAELLKIYPQEQDSIEQAFKIRAAEIRRAYH